MQTSMGQNLAQSSTDLSVVRDSVWRPWGTDTCDAERQDGHPCVEEHEAILTCSVQYVAEIFQLM